MPCYCFYVARTAFEKCEECIIEGGSDAVGDCVWSVDPTVFSCEVGRCALSPTSYVFC